MKKSLFSVMLFLICINLSAQVKSSVKFIPEKPCTGDSLTIIYTPGLNSPLLKADSVFLKMQLYNIKKVSTAEEYPMLRKGNKWIFTYKIADPAYVYILLEFGSTVFKQNDMNDGKAWGIKICDKQGNPVKGAYGTEGSTFMVHGMIWRFQDEDKYSEGLLKEYELFPNDPGNKVQSWQIRLTSAKNSDSVKSVILKEADEIIKEYPDDKALLPNVYYIYRFADTARATAIKKRIDSLDTKKVFDLHTEWNRLIFMPHGEKRLKEYYEYYLKAKGTSYEKDAGIEYFRSMIGVKYFKQAIQFFDNWKNPPLLDVVISGNQILTACRKELGNANRNEFNNSIDLDGKEAQTIELIKDARQLLEKSLFLYLKQTVKEKDKEYFLHSWLGERDRGIGLVYSNLGKADYLLKDYKSAEENFVKAGEYLGGYSRNPYSAGDYIKTLFALKRYKEAFDIAAAAFLKAEWDKYPDLKETMLKASEFLDKKHVSGKLEEIREHNQLFKPRMAVKTFGPDFSLKEAPAFSVNDLSGKNYSLNQLKGKTVVIHLWYTAGEACRRSGERFQNFYSSHRNDNNLVIISLNCNSSPIPKEITNFMKGKKWTFPVVLNSTYQLLDKFMPEDIPCTYFIGPDSKIYYPQATSEGSETDDYDKILEMIRKDFK